MQRTCDFLGQGQQAAPPSLALVRNVLEDVPRLAAKVLADPLESGEPHRPHVSRLDVRHVDARDADGIGELLYGTAALAHKVIQMEHYRHGATNPKGSSS